MTTPLNNLLSAQLAPSLYTVATFGSCEIGVAQLANSDLRRMPFDAFVLPPGHDISSLTRLAAIGSRIVSYTAAARTNVKQIDVMRRHAQKGAFVTATVADAAQAAADPAIQAMRSAFAVMMAARMEHFDSMAFETPDGWNEAEPLDGMIKGILTFLESAGSHPLRRVVITVQNAAMVEEARRFLSDVAGEAAERDIQMEIAHYLDAKNRHEPLPLHIPSYLDIFDTPLFRTMEQQRGERQFVIADVGRVASDHVRLVPNSLLDRAMEGVPAFLRTADAELPPPYIFARGQAGWRAVSKELRVKNVILERACTICDPDTDRHYVLGEIALIDTPRRHVADVEGLSRHILLPGMPRIMMEEIRESTLAHLLPGALCETIERGVPPLRSRVFSLDELDKHLVIQIRHECAEIFFRTLPNRFKARWKELYALERERKGDFIFYRNALRLFIENAFHGGDPQEFFAQETFADKLALFWTAPEDVPDIMREQGVSFTEEEREFFQGVMQHAKSLREQEGTAFAIGD